MKVASISQTKNQLSALLEQVRQGESVLIMDRGRPVARLEPVKPSDRADIGGQLAALERKGMIRRAAAPPPKKLVEQPPPRAAGSALEALLADRREGR